MIYVSSACIKAKKIADIIQIYSEKGIKNIELSGGTAYYAELKRDLKELKIKYGINYACHSYFPPPEQDFVVNLASCNDEIYERSIEHYKNCIKLLDYLKCKVLSIHAGFYVEITPKEIGRGISPDIVYDTEKATKRFCCAYEMINKLCKNSGIKLYLENNVLTRENFGRFGNKNLLMLTDFESYEKLKRQLDFELLLDLGHLYVSSNTLKRDYQRECEKMAPFVRWLHISENNGTVDQHKPLCENSEILEAYRRYFADNIPVTLETNGSVEQILNSMRLLW